MKRLFKLFAAFFLATGLLAATAAAGAAGVSAADTKAVRKVIQSQLDALAADDASRAYSFASPAIQKQVGSAESFMAMVRGGYPAVVAPASVSFLAPQWVEGTLVQAVQLTDKAGASWLAIYTMERQRDKSWRISGCQVRANEGNAT